MNENNEILIYESFIKSKKKIKILQKNFQILDFFPKTKFN